MGESVQAAVAAAHVSGWAYALAATTRVVRDFDLAEECVQEAYARALTDWETSGVPANPTAWLITVAKRRALDVLRRGDTARRALPQLVADDIGDDVADLAIDRLDPAVPDQRLRLISTCCHPALAREAQIALTLRLVCGMSTADVARSFLVSESTMAARITRAKKKIAVARIPYREPAVRELPERLDAICAVIFLLFTAGHTAPSGDALNRPELAQRAAQLARMVHQLVPGDRPVAGLLALILLTDARAAARVDATGALVTLAEQDRSRWDQRAIADGMRLLGSAQPSMDRYTLSAAIAAAHDTAATWADTDWTRIARLYELTYRVWPTPVVALNRAVAIGFAQGPAAALTVLDRLAGEPALATYGYYESTRAKFLRDLGRVADAKTAYENALLLTENAVERRYLLAQLAELG